MLLIYDFITLDTSPNDPAECRAVISPTLSQYNEMRWEQAMNAVFVVENFLNFLMISSPECRKNLIY